MAILRQDKRLAVAESKFGNLPMNRARSGEVLVFCIAILILGAAVVFAIRLPASPPKTDFHISILGYTNGPTGERLAVLSITNKSRSAMAWDVYPTQIQSNGSWAGLPRLRGAGPMLAAHQASEFTVAVPSDGSVWRVPFLWSYPPKGLGVVWGVVRSNIRLNNYRLRHGKSLELARAPEFEFNVTYLQGERR